VQGQENRLVANENVKTRGPVRIYVEKRQKEGGEINSRMANITWGRKTGARKGDACLRARIVGGAWGGLGYDAQHRPTANRKPSTKGHSKGVGWKKSPRKDLSANVRGM